MCVTRYEEIMPQGNDTVDNDLIDVIESDSGLPVDYSGIEKFVLLYFNGVQLNSAETVWMAFDNGANGFHCADHTLANATWAKLHEISATYSW